METSAQKQIWYPCVMLLLALLQAFAMGANVALHNYEVAVVSLGSLTLPILVIVKAFR